MNQGIESKFVTVVFPHANLDVSSDAVYLRRMSATFLLMDNIDGFYFHLQGNYFVLAVFYNKLLVKTTAG